MGDSAVPTLLKKALCALFIVAGVAIYLSWGILHGAWNPFIAENLGIYSLMAVLIGIGAVGLLILRWEEEERRA